MSRKRHRRRYRLRKGIVNVFKRYIRFISVLAIMYVINDLYINVSIGDIMKYVYVKKYHIQNVDQTDEEKVTAKVKELNALNDAYRNVQQPPLRSYRLKNYSLETDKLPFHNLSTENSAGLCNAFSLFEKYHYLDQLDKITFDRDDLQRQRITIEEIQGGSLSSYSLSDEAYTALYGAGILNPGEIKMVADEKMFRKSIDYYKENIENLENVVADKHLSNLLNQLNYLQYTLNTTNSGIQSYEQQSSVYTSRESTWRALIHNKDSKMVPILDVEGMIKNLESDIPVLIGLWQGTIGHSVLAYAYEEVEENVIKLYVSDSNIPLRKAGKTMPESQKVYLDRYNQDVKKNVYILLKKEQQLGKWAYVYNPCVNGNYLYNDMPYNFYLPDHSMEIECIE